MAALFDMAIIGPPPGNATTGADQWIALGVIPTGKKVWIGSVVYTSPGKSITFELRTSLAGQSAATTGATKLLSSVSMTPRAGTKTTDLYKNGSLHTVTVVGTGTEKWWLRLFSKSATAAEYLYRINYALE